MYWSNQSSENHKKQQNREQIKQFHKEKRQINSQNREQFKLQSCEKVKPNFSQMLHHHHQIPTSNYLEDKNFLTFGAKESFAYKKQTERLINLLINICSSSSQSNAQHQNAKEIINSFGRELQNLFDKYIQKFNAFQLPRQKKQEFNKKLILYIDDTFKKQFINISDIGETSQNIRELSNRSNDSIKSGENVTKQLKSSEFTTPTSISRHEAYPGQKGPLSKIQSSFNQVNRLLEKVIQPRFVRNSRLLSGQRSRESSPSVEQIMQRSIEQKKKRDNSNSSSKETLYKINKLLNE